MPKSKKKPFRWRKGVAVGVSRGAPPPVRKRRAKKVPQVHLEIVSDEEVIKVLATKKASFSRLPNRYWLQGENGLWSSVERGSAAHLAVEGHRTPLRRPSLAV